MESRGYEIFSLSKKIWKQVYDNKKDMRVLYNTMGGRDGLQLPDQT